ncbi:MAG: ABC transporter substrate-binding protein [Deltaproteobacteria bacterium]|nr:ABC transporter substrate-binding protein [Deltaproteobacteria bacterium]
MKQMMKCMVLVLAFSFLVVPAGAAEKNMVFSSPYGITTLDPSVSYSTELTYMANIYETLLRVNPPGSKEMFSYVLATGYSVSNDGMQYTFNLRKGVKFHDGTPFKAEAVKFSIERTRKIGKGAAFIWGDLKEIQIVDDYTVKMILDAPAPLPAIAASAYASYIMSPAVGEKGAEWFNQGNDAGTGPYTLANYKDGESWILKKFDGYWGGWSGNHVENVLVKYTKDALVQLQMLQSNEAMLVGRIPIDSYAKVRQDSNTKVVDGPSYSNYMAFFNTTRSPLDNQKVRKALAHAMPYDAIIEVGFDGKATQARGPVPQGQFGYSERVFQYDYDLEKAKKLLAQAGFPNGGFKLTLTYAAENVQEKRFAPLIQNEFKKLGVEVEIKGIAWSQQWAMAKGDPKEAQDIFLLLWWPTYSDPYETLYSLLHNEKGKPVWNLAYYVNPAYDKLIREAYEVTGSDPEKALDLYVEAQNLVQKDAPVAWLVDVQGNWPMNKKLQGFTINPAYPNVPFFYGLSIE